MITRTHARNHSHSRSIDHHWQCYWFECHRLCSLPLLKENTALKTLIYSTKSWRKEICKCKNTKLTERAKMTPPHHHLGHCAWEELHPTIEIVLLLKTLHLIWKRGRKRIRLISKTRNAARLLMMVLTILISRNLVECETLHNPFWIQFW